MKERIVKHFRIFLITLIGILISQVIATTHVYLANNQLANQIQYLKVNGYLIVPNLHVLPQLNSFMTAFIGGLFFTGTIGLGIISISLLISWFWINKTQNKILFLVTIFFQGIISIYCANRNGWCVFTLYLVLMLPLLTLICFIIPQNKKSSLANPKLFWSLPIIFMMIAGYTTGRSVSFITIRDYLLLSNDYGHYLNDLYYQYTLYPGEVIKPISLKQQKTCFIHTDSHDKAPYLKTIERKCILYDYLLIPDPKMADVVLHIQPPNIFFQIDDRTVLQTEIFNFLRDTKSVFSDFSAQTDSNDFFRMCILLSLTISAPILIYIILMQGLFGFFYLMKIPTFVCQWLVIIITCGCIGLIIHQLPKELSNHATEKNDSNEFQKAYQQKDWRKAVVALKSKPLTEAHKKHVMALQWLNQTDNPILKYWLIRFLSNSNTSINSDVYLKFLSDPNVNVVCQALYALGRQRDRKLIPRIIDFIQDCPHWYVQMYAYRSLKRLGWRNFSKK